MKNFGFRNQIENKEKSNLIRNNKDNSKENNLSVLFYTILDIHINFLRMFKNVLKKISFHNVRRNVPIFHKYSLMFIYIHLCSFVIIFFHDKN
jgi:hypothetical protein